MRAKARQMPDRLTVSPKPCCSTCVVWPSESPICLFIRAAKVKPQLHCRCPQSIGSLQWVPALNGSSTALALTDLDVKATHQGTPHDLFLILRLAALEGHRTAAVLALLRNRDSDLLVHPPGHRAAGVATVFGPGFTTGLFGVRLGFSSGMGAAWRLAARRASSSCFSNRSISASAARSPAAVARSRVPTPRGWVAPLHSSTVR